MQKFKSQIGLRSTLIWYVTLPPFLSYGCCLFKFNGLSQLKKIYLHIYYLFWDKLQWYKFPNVIFFLTKQLRCYQKLVLRSNFNNVTKQVLPDKKIV